MLSSLRGVICKGAIPLLTVDVNGVGYAVHGTSTLYESVQEGEEGMVHVHTFVREDRLELFGFKSASEREVFTQFLGIPGVGPRTALQLAAVPASVLLHAAEQEDARSLESLKGVGKRMAEKLIVELQALAEKGVLSAASGEDARGHSMIDDDALEALTNLGYDRKSMIQRLREVPSDAATTEKRVKHVLQTL